MAVDPGTRLKTLLTIVLEKREPQTVHPDVGSAPGDGCTVID